MADNSKAPARQGRALAWTSLVLIAVLFVAAVIATTVFVKGARLDLTQDKLFTLSPGTHSVLSKIDEPVTLRFYYSTRLTREIPQIGLYAQRVRDLLEEYAAASKGKVKLEILDPEPFTDTEDRAVAFGLQGVPVDQGGEVVYFGLAGTNSTDDVQTIPFFDQSRERFLEYDLTRMIFSLANPKKRVVGLVTSLPIAGNPAMRMQMPNAPDDSWIVYSQLKDLVQVERLSAAMTEVPADVDTLMIVHPKLLEDRALYAIDQFVMRGGKVLLFVDPYSEADAMNPQMGPGGRPMPPTDTSSNLEKLMTAWGVKMPGDKVAGDLIAARRVQVPGDPGQPGRIAAVDYPLWMALTKRNLDTDDPTTADLSSLNFASPGHLEKVDAAGTQFTPLIKTSSQGGLVDTTLLMTPRPDPQSIARAFKPTGEQILAAKLTGKVKSAFPDGPPALPADAKDEDKKKFEAEKAAHLKESKEPANVIVVADTDMLTDDMWVRVQDFFNQRLAVPVAQNGNFVLNAVENLSGSADLIGLRSRGVLQRPFTLVQDIQRESETRFRAKEQELAKSLNEAQKQLQQIQGDKSQGGTNTVLTQEQRTQIEKLRAEILDRRRELRDVQYALRRDVDNLAAWIKAINIGLIPLLVAIFAIAMALARRSARRAAARRS